MQIVLVIPPQPATQNEERQAALLSCFRNGSLLLQGTDFKKPAQFILKPNDSFPWKDFIQKMIVAWQLGDYSGLPREFTPQKRIPAFVIEDLPKEHIQNQLKVLATLRSQGYFPQLK
ncbi:MAG: hypothetical protein HUK20_02990 [Fibrobacter sp.]|nr:hypothetical protein [Fibrobacter sp.]